MLGESRRLNRTHLGMSGLSASHGRALHATDPLVATAWTAEEAAHAADAAALLHRLGPAPTGDGLLTESLVAATAARAADEELAALESDRARLFELLLLKEATASALRAGGLRCAATEPSSTSADSVAVDDAVKYAAEVLAAAEAAPAVSRPMTTALDDADADGPHVMGLSLADIEPSPPANAADDRAAGITTRPQAERAAASAARTTERASAALARAQQAILPAVEAHLRRHMDALVAFADASISDTPLAPPASAAAPGDGDDADSDDDLIRGAPRASHRAYVAARAAALPDDVVALKGRIARLQADVAAARRNVEAGAWELCSVATATLDTLATIATRHRIGTHRSHNDLRVDFLTTSIHTALAKLRMVLEQTRCDAYPDDVLPALGRVGALLQRRLEGVIAELRDAREQLKRYDEAGAEFADVAAEYARTMDLIEEKRGHVERLRSSVQ